MESHHFDKLFLHFELTKYQTSASKLHLDFEKIQNRLRNCNQRQIEPWI